MDKQEKNRSDSFTIDLVQLMRALWHRAWIIALAGVLAAAIGFGYSAFMVKPQYSSSIMLYVNNSSFSLGTTSFSISSSEITAAQSLVKTYGELLNNRTTLERIIDKTGVPYTAHELSKMITSESSNGTEIMRVTVTGKDPYEASKIANCIAEVLPMRIAEIVDGASMEVVDSAIPNLNKVSPNITKYTALGMILGVLLSTVVLAVMAMRDDTIYDEEYVLQTYDYPILAKIPNLLGPSTSRYGMYKKTDPKSGTKGGR